MADKRSELLQKLNAEYCVCSLGGHTLNLPRVLPCFHTFCSPCLETYIAQQISDNGQRTFPCPVCSRPTNVPQGTAKHTYADGFKSDTFITKLSEVIEAYKDSKCCDICKRREISQLASSWCMDCFDAVCEDCTKVHLCGKTTSDHIIVSLEELRKLSLENVMKRTTSYPCTKHEEDFVKLYCLDCKEPVCVQCLAMNHRKCEACVPISEAMKVLEDDVTEVLVRLRSINSEGANDVTAEETGAEVLEESVKKAEAGIRSLADELRRKIDESEQALLERLHSVSSQLHDKVGDFRNLPGSREDDVKTLASAQDRMDALLMYGSDLEVLDVYNSVKATLSRMDGTSSSTTSLSDDEVRLKVNFDIDDPVKVFCRDFERLGEIRVEDCNSDDGLASWGVAVTSRDEIIVADCRNKRVQKFASSGDLIDHIQISEEPRDLTGCGDDDVAITIMKKQIFVVTVTGNMALKRRFKTEKQYDGIAHASSIDSFLVSCLEDKCVDVISTQGDFTKTFNVNGTTGESMFGIPRYVAVSKDGHFIISDAANNSVTCITQDGALMFSYAPTSGTHELKKAQGVCCDKMGNLFVGDYANSRIHLLTSEGNFQRFVLGRDSGLRRPVAVAMTQSNKLVVVQSDGMVKIFSYESMKVKVKVPCWCPRCVSNSAKVNGEGNSADGENHQRNEDKRSNGNQPNHQGHRVDDEGQTSRRRISSSGGSAFSYGGSSRSGSESYDPKSPVPPNLPMALRPRQ